MVNISIDVTDLGGEARPGDKVVFWRPRMGGSATHAGRVISTAPVTVFLTDGKATVSDVEPGEMTVLLQCRGVESQGPVTVGVPDGNGTVTLRSLIESQFEYAPPIVSAVQEAAANASASERAAIEAQVRSEAAADRAEDRVDDAINNGANLVRNEVKQDADRAVSARQAATQSESNAAASESAAASSASSAAASESAAKQSEDNAGDFAAVATTAATEAVDAMEVASEAASSIGDSVSRASTSAENAAQSEANAAQYESSAATHAQNATEAAEKVGTAAELEAWAQAAQEAADRVGTAEQVGAWAQQAQDAADSIGTAEQVETWVQQAQDAADSAAKSASTISAVPLTPLFLDPLPFGVQSGGPENVRAGLSPQHGPGGGWVEEMSIPVVGNKGAKILTSTDVATVDGFVTQRWQAAVSTGKRDFYVEVVGTGAGGVIHLRDPLPVDVEGYLSARYDTAQSGQHLTRRGTRAYVESLLNTSPIFASRGSIITGAWADQPVSLQSLWRKNEALEEAGFYEVTEGGRVVVGLISHSPLNSYDPDRLTPFAHGATSQTRAGVGGAGQGLIAEFAPAGRATVFEFSVGCYRPSQPPESFAVNVKVTADGVVILDTPDDGALRNYRIPIAGVGNMTVEVTSAATTEHYLVVSETTLRTANADTPRQGRGKIVTLGDSWMAWYDGEFGKALAEKAGTQVVNHSLGGMTTEWGLAWWDEYVTSEKPDEVWIHFFTNDLNALTGQTFVAPDGSTKPLWTVNAGADSRRVWRQNIWEMIRRAQSSGIRPVIIMPSATVGPNQTQNHMRASSVLETPPLDSSYSATPAEVNSIEWVGNRRNKYKGKPLRVGSSTVWATGSQPKDAWVDPNSDILLGLQRLTLNRSDYVTDATGYRHVTLGNVTGDVVVFDNEGDVPSLTVTWGDEGSTGAHRIAGDVSAIVGREYLTVVQIAEATSRLNSSLTNVSGSYVPLSGDGQDYNLRREVAGTSNATIQVGVQRGDLSSGSQTKIAATLAIIDVAALLRDAPNLESKTDLELAQFALSLK